MTALPVRSPMWWPFWTFVLLLQMATSLEHFIVVLNLSSEIISHKIIINFLTSLVTMCFYGPVVLLAFALLATLLATYAKDITVLRFSVICQAGSSLLTLVGIIGYLLLHLSHLPWKDMTLWFYMLVLLQAQLIVTTVLTRETTKMLAPQWE